MIFDGAGLHDFETALVVLSNAGDASAIEFGEGEARERFVPALGHVVQHGDGYGLAQVRAEMKCHKKLLIPDMGRSPGIAGSNPAGTGPPKKGKGSRILGAFQFSGYENVVYDCEPSLRFSVGRSSSVLVPVPLPLSVEGLSAVARRNVGRSLLSLSFCTLCRF